MLVASGRTITLTSWANKRPLMREAINVQLNVKFNSCKLKLFVKGTKKVNKIDMCLINFWGRNL